MVVLIFFFPIHFFSDVLFFKSRGNIYGYLSNMKYGHLFVATKGFLLHCFSLAYGLTITYCVSFVIPIFVLTLPQHIYNKASCFFQTIQRLLIVYLKRMRNISAWSYIFWNFSQQVVFSSLLFFKGLPWFPLLVNNKNRQGLYNSIPGGRVTNILFKSRKSKATFEKVWRVLTGRKFQKQHLPFCSRMRRRRG